MALGMGWLTSHDRDISPAFSTPQLPYSNLAENVAISQEYLGLFFFMSPARPCLSFKQKVNARMKRAAETKSEMLLGLVAYDSHTTLAVCLL